MDGVAVIVVEDEDVIIATDGGYNKTTGLIGTDLASDGVAVGVDVVCAVIRTFLKNWRESGRGCGGSTEDVSIGGLCW